MDLAEIIWRVSDSKSTHEIVQFHNAIWNVMTKIVYFMQVIPWSKKKTLNCLK